MTYFIDPYNNQSTFSFFSEFSTSYRGQLFLELLLLTAITVCGSLGNLLVIISTVTYKHMRTTSNIILSLQATCDLILCCALPLIMVVRATQQWMLGNAACKVWMFIFSCSQVVSSHVEVVDNPIQATFSFGITTLCMSALSIDRYLCICRPERYNFLKRHPYFTLIIIVLVGLSVNCPFVLGWNTVTIERDGRSYTFCGLQWPNILNNKAYIYVILFIDFFVPLITTVLVYSIIWLQVRESARRVVSITNTRSTGTVGAKLLKILVLSVILYVFMFAPFVVASVILFYSDMISSSVFLVILAILLADTMVNPILLPVLNTKYRNCMRATMKCRRAEDPRRLAVTVQRTRIEH